MLPWNNVVTGIPHGINATTKQPAGNLTTKIYPCVHTNRSICVSVTFYVQDRYFAYIFNHLSLYFIRGGHRQNTLFTGGIIYLGLFNYKDFTFLAGQDLMAHRRGHWHDTLHVPSPRIPTCRQVHIAKGDGLSVQKILLPEMIWAILSAWSPIFSKLLSMSMNIRPDCTSQVAVHSLST